MNLSRFGSDFWACATPAPLTVHAYVHTTAQDSATYREGIQLDRRGFFLHCRAPTHPLGHISVFWGVRQRAKTRTTRGAKCDLGDGLHIGIADGMSAARVQACR